jgi:phage-related protein
MPARHDTQPKPVRWIGSSQEDLRDFPEEVRRRVGGALWDAQLGRKALYAKPPGRITNNGQEASTRHPGDSG